MTMLTGSRVLDLSRLLPGPYATQLLADLGAEIIKIERPPEGDYMRIIPPMFEFEQEGRTETISSVFAQVNRGKKSVVIDFSSQEGRDLLLRLAQRADVFVESFRPGALERRGLDYNTLHTANPRLVYCSLSGYGQDGPYRHRAGHDGNYLALAGVLGLNANPGQGPALLPVQMADLAGGMSAAMRILAALVARDRTGEGEYLDLALFDSAINWMQTIIGAFYRAEKRVPTPGGTQLTGLYPCYHLYPTSDGYYMSLCALEPSFWTGFCEAIDREELIEKQFDPGAIEEVTRIFRDRPRTDWITFAKRHDVCLEPLLEITETLEHPQVQARHLADADTRHVPRMGENTVQVLHEFGLEQEEIDALLASGVVRTDEQDGPNEH